MRWPRVQAPPEPPEGRRHLHLSPRPEGDVDGGSRPLSSNLIGDAPPPDQVVRVGIKVRAAVGRPRPVIAEDALAEGGLPLSEPSKLLGGGAGDIVPDLVQVEETDVAASLLDESGGEAEVSRGIGGVKGEGGAQLRQHSVGKAALHERDEVIEELDADVRGGAPAADEGGAVRGEGLGQDPDLLVTAEEEGIADHVGESVELACHGGFGGGEEDRAKVVARHVFVVLLVRVGGIVRYGRGGNLFHERESLRRLGILRCGLGIISPPKKLENYVGPFSFLRVWL
mmetsp:Transcript_4298/g.8345  ORF Transcript_4298/g.8345 Transcript_4298/m.8345 type:complete len:284 (-) Transcript_4298:711-1562(-)